MTVVVASEYDTDVAEYARMQALLDSQPTLGRTEALGLRNKTRQLLADTKDPAIIIILATLDRALKSLIEMQER